MQQESPNIKQVAKIITYFLEPAIPYLVIGSKKAAEEAEKKMGLEKWELEKKLWARLCSKEPQKLKDAAGNIVIFPFDPQIKQALIQEIFKTLEHDPNLAKEISSIIEENLEIEERAYGVMDSGPNEKQKVLTEFNKLHEEFLAKKKTPLGSEQLKKENGKENLQEDLLGKTLDFASRIQYGDLRSRALSMIVPQIEGQGKGKLLEKALYSTSDIQDEAERALVLSSLAPHLGGVDRAKLIEEILDFSPYIQYSDAKFQIFSSLIPYLEEIKNGEKNEKLLEKALEVAFGIQSTYLRIQALSLIMPHLKGQRNEEILDEALELAFNLKDKGMRSQALQSVFPYLDEERKKEIKVKEFLEENL
jgi:hypothetical protein